MKNDAGIRIKTVSKKDWDYEISGYFPDKECSIIDSHGNVVAQVLMILSLPLFYLLYSSHRSESYFTIAINIQKPNDCTNMHSLNFYAKKWHKVSPLVLGWYDPTP